MNEAVASAPASTANLGPGFDCLALAISLRCTVRARASDTWSIEYTGEHRPEQGEGDGVLAAARHAVGNTPLSISVETHIPFGKGLGSSAAAFVAGAAAALRAVGQEGSPDRVFRIAAELEGHPDQAAAAVYGGLVLIPAEGMPIRLPLHPSLRPVVGVPDTRLSTAAARAALPGSVDRQAVVRSLARVSALVAGLISGDPGMLAAAHGDEIHEAPRAGLDPEVVELIDVARRAGALHAARSGSGPSVLAISRVEDVEKVAQGLNAHGVEVITEPVDTTGLV